MSLTFASTWLDARAHDVGLRLDGRQALGGALPASRGRSGCAGGIRAARHAYPPFTQGRGNTLSSGPRSCPMSAYGFCLTMAWASLDSTGSNIAPGQANELQGAQDSGQGQPGSVKLEVGQDGGTQYDGPPPVTGEPPKQPEQPAVSIP
jgi:hypothetical protein